MILFVGLSKNTRGITMTIEIIKMSNRIIIINLQC